MSHDSNSKNTLFIPQEAIKNTNRASNKHKHESISITDRSQFRYTEQVNHKIYFIIILLLYYS